ncbi:vicilin [Striga asiatica]|uniref:Vicilin n=1 Tax=Striga asiatica TaxID=4170 RepID=A0A5A7RCX0_STRAF|nr:vicilin [Striga asiatica]
MSSGVRFGLALLGLILAQAALGLAAQEPRGKSPIERLRECTQSCERQRQSPERQEVCKKRCQEEYEREKERYEEDIMTRGEREKESSNSPYVFEDRHFMTGMKTQHGQVRILQRFTERSDLLRGIENYRVTLLEADPQTFVVPNHWDANAVIFVANGRGIVSLLRQDRRESFNIKQGDIFRINSGTTTYLINSDKNQKLVLAKLLQPVNTPGQFQSFFGAGGENPESFFKAFSKEILEAAFNTRSDRLQRIFGQQKQGVIMKASEEQIRSMSHHEEGGIWPFAGEAKGTSTINIYQQQPKHRNQYGQLFEVDPTNYRQLKDLNIAVSLANITQAYNYKTITNIIQHCCKRAHAAQKSTSRGAMTAPYYNSETTKITLVLEGQGYCEMACPHLAEEESRRQQGSEREKSEREKSETSTGPRYQKVSARLKRGTVMVVPAGHPFVAVASKNQNLQLLCFEVNQKNNEKYTLAGRKNVMKYLEKEAKELAFGMPAREVEEVFNSQEEEFFFKGPRQEHEGRAEA